MMPFEYSKNSFPKNINGYYAKKKDEFINELKILPDIV